MDEDPARQGPERERAGADGDDPRGRERDGGGGDEAARGETGGAGARAWIPVVGVDDAEGELAEAYRRIGARDRASNVVAVHSLHPDAMEDHLSLYRTLMFGPSPLSRREREAIAVVVSAANDCFY